METTISIDSPMKYENPKTSRTVNATHVRVGRDTCKLLTIIEQVLIPRKLIENLLQKLPECWERRQT